MFLVLFLVTLEFNFTGKEQKFTLAPGKYRVHCIGAQGGDSLYMKIRYPYVDLSYGNKGGYGAEVIGEMTITGEERTFYAYVGGKGEDGVIVSDGYVYKKGNGGWNGGGRGGVYSGYDYYYNCPGGGGGPSDIRIDGKEIDDRIIVAAGGSGAAYKHIGAAGGDLKGKYIQKIDGNYIYENSPHTNQTNGYGKGQGGNGENGTITGSGGGGYYGGEGGYSIDNTASNLAVGDSGSSYISGYDGCSIHPNMRFENGKMIVGDPNEGNGKTIIEILDVCSENCYSCSENGACDVCNSGYEIDSTTKKCILKPSVSTKSHVFTLSKVFSESKGLQNLLFFQAQLISQNLLFFQTQLISQNLLFFQIQLISQNLLFFQIQMISQNLLFFQTQLISQNLLFFQTQLFSQNLENFQNHQIFLTLLHLLNPHIS